MANSLYIILNPSIILVRGVTRKNNPITLVKGGLFPQSKANPKADRWL